MAVNHTIAEGRYCRLMAALFSYDPAVLERFPTIRAGVIYVSGLLIGHSPDELTAMYIAEQAAVTSRLEEAPIASLPSIAAWRRTFNGFGVKPTQYRNAAESLLRRLAKHGDIPSISVLVDIGNLVSIRYGLPVAFFDQAQVTGGTMVRFAAGDENFTDLGAAAAVHPLPDEVIFVDDAKLVSARRWCWRQSAQSATGPGTTTALVTVEGHHETAETDVAAAAADIAALLGKHQPQAFMEAAALSPVNPVFTPQ